MNYELCDAKKELLKLISPKQRSNGRFINFRR